jgi:hypothetical protein
VVGIAQRTRVLSMKPGAFESNTEGIAMVAELDRPAMALRGVDNVGPITGMQTLRGVRNALAHGPHITATKTVTWTRLPLPTWARLSTLDNRVERTRVGMTGGAR